MHSMAVCALMVSLAPPARHGRDRGARSRSRRPAARHGQGDDAARGAEQARQADRRRIRHHEDAPAAAASTCCRRARASARWCSTSALHHHERPDGKGYPDGLSGEALTRIARMGAVCDVYDAITSNRPYKEGWDPADSIAKMASWAQGQFDPDDLPGLRQELGHLPDRLARADALGQARVWSSSRTRSLARRTEASRCSSRSRSNMPIAARDLLDLSGEPRASDAIVGARKQRAVEVPAPRRAVGGRPRTCRKIGKSLITRPGLRRGRRGSGSPGARRRGSSAPGAAACAASRASRRCGAAGRSRVRARRA